MGNIFPQNTYRKELYKRLQAPLNERLEISFTQPKAANPTFCAINSSLTILENEGLLNLQKYTAGLEENDIGKKDVYGTIRTTIPQMFKDFKAAAKTYIKEHPWGPESKALSQAILEVPDSCPPYYENLAIPVFEGIKQRQLTTSKLSKQGLSPLGVIWRGQTAYLLQAINICILKEKTKLFFTMAADPKAFQKFQFDSHREAYSSIARVPAFFTYPTDLRAMFSESIKKPKSIPFQAIARGIQLIGADFLHVATEIQKIMPRISIALDPYLTSDPNRAQDFTNGVLIAGLSLKESGASVGLPKKTVSNLASIDQWELTPPSFPF